MALIKETSEGAVTVEFSAMTDKELLDRIVFPEAIAELLKRESKETRAVRYSSVERRIVKDSDKCALCVANNDPHNVPVHPNCHCDVITDSVETGTVDSEHRLFNPLNQELVELIVDGDQLPSSVQLDPVTTAVMNAEEVRWADLQQWLQQMEPYLAEAGNYMAIVVDEDTEEAAAQVEELIQTIAEDLDQFPEAIQNRNLWFALTKSVVF